MSVETDPSRAPMGGRPEASRTSDASGTLDASGTRGTPVCRLDDIEVEGGVVALVDGEAVAVFRTYADEVYALANYDPVGRASVLSRGIVGTRTVDEVDVPFVASPLHKQAYDLRTGRCLDAGVGAALRVPTYAVTLGADRTVWVGSRQSPDEEPHEPES
ncbi:nitrite reductase small subunit NirD [Nocardioides sp.]|uniref:nitrite reductase small subunit NirD n=1 Tax=Nocardioides sp. TaxID=35761 RepID=UPI00321B7F49